MSKTEKPSEATVDYIREARPGDFVWLFDSQRNRYGPSGEYQGRGVYSLERVDDRTRISLIIGREKFALDTGTERELRGYSSRRTVYGRVERENAIWLSQRTAIGEAVSRCQDVEKLKAIQAILLAGGE